MQINRLFEIVYILLEHQCMTAKELANRFEVSVRTIYRDIDVLSAAGIPIYMTRGKGGGISLLPNFILNKTVLKKLRFCQHCMRYKLLIRMNRKPLSSVCPIYLEKPKQIGWR